MASMKIMIVMVVVCLASVALIALANNPASENDKNIVNNWESNRKYIENQMDKACATVQDATARAACQQGMQASKDALAAQPLSKPGYHS